MTPDEFLTTIAPYAVEDARKSGVLPSLTLAQAILESAWGKSRLAIDGRNLFGIKGTGSAGRGLYPTAEYVNGQRITVTAGFRHYGTWAGSIADHSALLTGNKRYEKVVGETDYKKACRAIQAAGYATDPRYAEKLIGLIETYRLDRFDRMVTKLSKEDADALLHSLHRLLAVAKLTDDEKKEIYRQGQIIRKAAGMQ